MSSNVGLSTPRGSGTSGYVQRNLSHLKPRDDNDRRTSSGQSQHPDEHARHAPRQPDPAILEHERKRRIEVQLFALRDALEDAGELDDEAVEERVDALRARLEREEDARVDARALKGHQVHDLARAKIEETERVRKALGIARDYEEGGHWRRQEERAGRGGGPAERVREEDEERESEVERRQDRQRKRRSYRDRDGERWEDHRSRNRSPDA